jgi:hypothetical protein
MHPRSHNERLWNRGRKVRNVRHSHRPTPVPEGFMPDTAPDQSAVVRRRCGGRLLARVGALLAPSAKSSHSSATIRYRALTPASFALCANRAHCLAFRRYSSVVVMTEQRTLRTLVRPGQGRWLLSLAAGLGCKSNAMRPTDLLSCTTETGWIVARRAWAKDPVKARMLVERHLL